MSHLPRVLAIVAAASAFADSGPAFAHAFLDHATPAVGSSVERAPPQVMLRFNEPLEPAFSWVKVFDADGKEVDRGDRQLDAADRAVMRVSVPALPAGKYRVAWRALSADAHVTQGDYTFEVKR